MSEVSWTFFTFHSVWSPLMSLTLLLTSTCTQGPVFAIIGAWLMYQIQNKDLIASDASESLFQKAVIITALMFILSHFGPIDEWYVIHSYSEKVVQSWNSIKTWKEFNIMFFLTSIIFSTSGFTSVFWFVYVVDT